MTHTDVAQYAHENGQTAACGSGAPSVDSSPADGTNGSQRAAQALATLTVTVRGATPQTAHRRAEGIRDLIHAEFDDYIQHTAIEPGPDNRP